MLIKFSVQTRKCKAGFHSDAEQGSVARHIGPTQNIVEPSKRAALTSNTI